MRLTARNLRQPKQLLALRESLGIEVDIETLLAHFLPRRDTSVDEEIRQMEERHRKRQASFDFSYAKQ